MKIISALLFSIILTLNAYAQLTPHEAIKQMSRGINIGNTFDAPNLDWGNSDIKESYFDDFKNAGLTCIRIPIRWENRIAETSPYTIDESWLNHVEEVIDWGLSRNLFIIINAHHDNWIKLDYDNQSARFDSLWAQVSNRFKDKSDHLLFEILNEPVVAMSDGSTKGLTVEQINELNARILSIIRKTNPTRIVCISGNSWSGAYDLMKITPPNDKYLIGYFHSYDPSSFALEAKGKWGTNSDQSELKKRFQQVLSWAEKYDLPISVNEFGAIRFYNGKTTDFNSRMLHYAKYVEYMIELGIAFNAWDNGSTNGDFMIYKRSTGTWDNDVKDILQYYSPLAPSNIVVSQIDNSKVQVSFTQRDTNATSIALERRNERGSYKTIATAKANDTNHLIDSTEVSAGNSYIYRVKTFCGDSISTVSYPVKQTIEIYDSAFISTLKLTAEIYPNPTSNYINVNLPNATYKIDIYSQNGDKVCELIMKDNENIIPINNLASGIYFIHFTNTTTQQSFTSKLIKQP